MVFILKIICGISRCSDGENFTDSHIFERFSNSRKFRSFPDSINICVLCNITGTLIPSSKYIINVNAFFRSVNRSVTTIYNFATILGFNRAKRQTSTRIPSYSVLTDILCIYGSNCFRSKNDTFKVIPTTTNIIHATSFSTKRVCILSIAFFRRLFNISFGIRVRWCSTTVNIHCK